MINTNSYYKGIDLNNHNSKDIKKNYFNPYEYNIESNLKDNSNSDLLKIKSKNHAIRNEYLKKK